jgi:F5/8 type C domain
VRNAVLAAALFAAFCAPRQTQKTPSATAAPSAAAAPNLLSLSQGAAVVSRTSEAVLDASAVRAIDTDPHTMWVSPPDDPQQTLVFSLPARARIDQIGLRSGSKAVHLASGIRFDLSTDGQNFTPVATIRPVVSETAQMVRIPLTNAAFVRVNVLGAKGTYVQIASVNATGTLIEAPAPASIDGCFAVNGFPAAFVQKGAEVVGEVAGGARPTIVEGGSDGRFFRFAWVRGPEYGLAAVSVTPDGRHLSGIVWHEEALQESQFFAADWLGDRVSCEKQAAPPSVSVFRSYLERFGRFPLFSLRFDESGRLHDGDSAATLSRVTAFLSANPTLPIRFVAHELLHSTPDENRRIAQARIDSLRAALQKNGVKLAKVAFVALGAETPHRKATTDLTRAMYSSVDLEVAVPR